MIRSRRSRPALACLSVAVSLAGLSLPAHAQRIAREPAPARAVAPEGSLIERAPSTAVVSGAQLRTFLAQASTRRIDLVCLGDSNQLFAGHGWDHGLSKALADRVGLYATGLHFAGENVGNSAGVGYFAYTFSTAWTNLFAYAGAPADADRFLNSASSGLAPANYLSIAPGTVTPAGPNIGMAIDPGGPWNVSAAWRFHFTYAAFPAAGLQPGWGVFRPMVRLNQAPWTWLAQATPIDARANQVEPSAGVLELPAASRPGGLNFRFSDPATGITGPFVAYSMRAEQSSRTTGASVHTLYGKGGQSAYDFARALQLSSDDTLAWIFSQVRALQPAPARVIVRINTGLNDRNETERSLGPLGVLPGDSAEAYADNLTAILNRIESVWVGQGWELSELAFLLTPSHAFSLPEDPELVAYRAAAAQIARTRARVGMVDLAQILPADQMLARGFYQSGGTDRAHLTQAGFEFLAARELDAIRWSRD